MSVQLLGAVLAGGESRRLGRDKAIEPLGSDTLVDRAIEALKAECAEVVVVSSRPVPDTASWTVVPDLRVGAGPLAGIEAALDHARRSGCDATFVLACDLPLVDGSVVAEVLAALGGAPCAAVAREGRPDFEPLCAVYRTECLDPVRALLDRGERAAWTLLEEMGGRRVAAPAVRLLNVNTEEDLARARAALGMTADGGDPR